MNCHSVQNSFSAHLDGCLPEEARRSLVSHLDSCAPCQTKLGQMIRLRSELRRLPVNQPPDHLRTKLRVIASKERQRVLARQSRLEKVAERLRLWVDNLMRPLALPFAGGLVSAMLLFAMLIPTFAFRRGVVGNDVPVALFTEPSIKAQMAFDGFDFDVDCVEVTVNEQGRMVDYNVVNSATVTPELRRALENQLLFTEFTPATMFGQPTYGRVYLSFHRASIEIKS